MKKLMIISALLVGSFSLANAQTQTPVVRERQENQQARIRQGARSGELTPRETHRLEKQERNIRKEERTYKADGKVTRAERRDLNHDLNRENRTIAHQKHDAQKRPRARRF